MRDSIYIFIGCPYLKKNELKGLYHSNMKVLIADDVGLYPDHDYFYDYLSVNTMDVDEFYKQLVSWVDRHNFILKSIFTLAEGSVNLCNELAHRFSLDPISNLRNINLRDKYRIREQLQSTKFSIPIFDKYLSSQKPKSYSSSDYPLIVKPIDSMASRNVRLVNNSIELESALHDVFYNKTIVSIDDVEVNVEAIYNFEEKAIVESYITGQEISIEVLILGGNVINWFSTLKVTSGAPYFQETGHISGLLDLNEEQCSNIDQLLGALCRIQQYHSTILHVEIKLLEDNSILLIECNSRGAGDGVLGLLNMTTDNNILVSFLKKEIHFTSSFKKVASRFYLTSDKSGRFYTDISKVDYGELCFYYKTQDVVKPLSTEKIVRVGDVLIQDKNRSIFNIKYEKLMLELNSLFKLL